MGFQCRLSPLTWLLLLLAGCTPKVSTEPIQIAHLLALTGPDKQAAVEEQRGVLLAVEEINAEDQRIAGRTVVVRNIDTQDNPEVVQAEAVRLITLNKISAFLTGSDTRCAERLVRTAQSYSVPVVVTGDFPPGTGLDGFLSLAASPATRGERLAHYAVKELKAQRAVVLTDQRNPVAVAVASSFMNEWPRARPATLEEWPFRNDTEQIDFAAKLSKLQAPVALFCGSPEDFLKLQEQLRERKATISLLFGGDDVGVTPLLKSGMTVVTATAYAAEGLSDKGKEFARRYTERYQEPPGLQAAQAYDAARLLFETMQQAKTGAAGRVREDLMHLETFDSVTGKIIWKERQLQRPVFLLQIAQGEAKLLPHAGPTK